MRQFAVPALFAFVLGAVGQVSSANAQNVKLGYIDSQRILAEFKEAQDAQKKLDEIVAHFDGNLGADAERADLQSGAADQKSNPHRTRCLLFHKRWKGKSVPPA